jgi:cytochrome c oxidase subunit 4
VSYDPAAAAPHSHTKLYLQTYFALLVLLALTVGAAFVHLGSASLIVALLVAFAKTTLILAIFMHLKDEIPLIRFAGLIGFAWLAMFLLILAGDYETRNDVVPGRSPLDVKATPSEPVQRSAADAKTSSANPSESQEEPTAR